MKTCYLCETEKLIDQFDAGRNRCKDCRRKLHREKWNRKTPEQKAQHVLKMVEYQRTPAGMAKQRRARLKSRYGMSLEDYEEMLAAQGGSCALCPATISQDGRRLAVDHDHATGKVRGILCLRCNNQISLVDRLGIEALASYLARGEVSRQNR